MIKNRTLKSKVWVVLLTIMVLVSGCSGGPAGQEEVKQQPDTRRVTDILGREVEVSTELKAIGVTPIPYASIIYAIDGGGEKLVAMNPSAKQSYEMSILAKLAPEMAEVETKYIAADFSINLEEIVNLNPDLMVVWSTQEAEIQKLEELSIPVIALTNGGSGNIEDFQANMRIIGEALGKEDRAEAFISLSQEVLEYLEGKADQVQNENRPRVLYMRDKELKVAASKAFNNITIDLTGGKNVAEEVAGAWAEVSMEQILAWDPEIIYLSAFDDFVPADFYENRIPGQDWSYVDAVKNKRVYKTPHGIYRWDAPSVETPLLLKWMAQTQQPEIFNDFDFEADLKKFYEEFFAYELTATEVAEIMNKAHNS